MRPRRRLSGWVAVATASILALSGMAGVTSSAMAEEPAEQCSGANIEGQGSSLQKVAQQIWNDENSLASKGFNNSGNVMACNGAQGAKLKPVVKYNPSGSGAGKKAWGAESGGNKALDGKKENPAESGNAFIGTDEAPNPTQLKNIDEAAEGVGAAGQALVIPVEQAAVGVIVNPPSSECEITKITNGNLQEIWNGGITEWSGITGGKAQGAGVTEKTAGACKVAIKRIVRKDSSGTTFAFKTYLAEINKGNTCAGAGPPAKTWTFYAEAAHNLEWPQEPAGTCKGTVTVATENGGGGEVKEVVATSGSIGYANLADARAGYTDKVGNNYYWLGVQNQHFTNSYPFPGNSASEPSLTAGESNCKETKYGSLPSVGADDDWSKVNGGHPGNGTLTNENYPICTLTYDVALVNYELAKDFTNAEATTAYNYLNYVVDPEGGQTDIVAHDYLEVQAAVGTFAQEEAELIGGGTHLQYLVGGAVTKLLVFAALNTPVDLSIDNIGPNPYTVSKLVIDPFSGAFSILVGGTCTNGLVLASGESCLVEVEATASGLAWLTDWLQILLHIEDV